MKETSPPPHPDLLQALKDLNRPPIKLVEITYEGGWRELNALRWQGVLRNALLFLQLILLALILIKLS